MVKYVVTGPKVVFGAGFVLGLTAEQARTRKHLVKKDGKYYRVLESIQFKRDEVIDIITQNLTKSTLNSLELFSKTSTPTKSQPKADNKQKKKEVPEEDPPAEVEDEDVDPSAENEEEETLPEEIPESDDDGEDEQGSEEDEGLDPETEETPNDGLKAETQD